MLHDLLLTCLNLSCERQIEEIIDSNELAHLVHPCEKRLLEEIIKQLNILRDVVHFNEMYGGHIRKKKEYLEQGTQIYGLYINSFATGLNKTLQRFYKMISDLEDQILKNSKNSLVCVYEKIQVQMPLIKFLRQLIFGIKTKKLHGCMLLEYLYQQSNRSDLCLQRSLAETMKPVKLVFMSQLTSWILYGQLDDDYSEFFIYYSKKQIENVASKKKKAAWKNKHIVIWDYKIDMLKLPRLLSTKWAENVLFIGQTVLVFKSNRYKNKDNNYLLDSFKQKESHDKIDLWREHEFIFYNKLITYAAEEDFNVYGLEEVTNNIKKYVTCRLSEIALNEVDLKRQITLLKDFYLLGRGEFYLEFLHQLYTTDGVFNRRTEPSNCVRIFESAAHAVGASDVLKDFKLIILKPSQIVGDDKKEFEALYLKYTIVWPLNLMFSPKAIDRYNMIFRFLLLLRKIQYELNKVWCDQIYTAKITRTTDIALWSLRNQLLFFMDNFQYYVQIDVLESQFDILFDVISNQADFEEIQRAHSIFQVNVLSQCFLLSEENAVKASLSDVHCKGQNLIYCILNDLFQLCAEFSEVFGQNCTNDISKITEMEEKFNGLIQHLMKQLFSIKTCKTPLSQLLLRLDYNHWFSKKKSQVIKSNK